MLSDRADVLAAVIYGSWSSDSRRPDSDVDVLVVGDADCATCAGNFARSVRAWGERST